MINGHLIKHPDAVAEYEFVFTDSIPTDDFLGDYTVLVTDSEGIDVTEDLVLIASLDTDRVTVLFQGGLAGMNYTARVQVSMDLSTTTPVRIIELRVREESPS